jgi:hypothetical protein
MLTRESIGLSVPPHQVGVVEIGEHVAVHDQKVFRQPVEQPQHRAHGAQRHLLRHPVVDLHAPPAAVTGVGPDQLAEVADGQGDPAEAGPGELAQQDFHDRVLLADRHEGLGESRRVGPQPDALAPGENDRVHAASVVHWLYSSGL